MNLILLGLLGTLAGLVLSILVFRWLLSRPNTRVLVVNWLNWGSNELPEGTHQLVRHGKWIAYVERKKQ